MSKGLNELAKSPQGRLYIEKIRKENKLKLLQPDDPLFLKVYGDDIKKKEEVRLRQIRESKDMWQQKDESRIL